MEEHVTSHAVESDELASIILSLIDVMKAEESLLSEDGAQDLASLVDIKEALTQRYRQLISQINWQSDEIHQEEVLIQALSDLRSVASRNEILLRSALETTSIYLDEALKMALKSRVQIYDARGRLPAARYNGSAMPIAMTVTHQL